MTLYFTAKSKKTLENGTVYYDSYGTQQEVTYWPATKSFTTDIHTIYPVGQEEIRIVDGRTNKQIIFIYEGTDLDGSNEDIYGWRYYGRNDRGERISLLIVND